MTKRKIAAWIMLPVVAACCSDAAPSVTPAPERPSSSQPVAELVEVEPAASELELGCAELPSWRPYSTVPLMYHPPCRFGEMVVRAAASRPTPEEELEQARAENTALHERLRKMAAYEARVGAQ